MAARRFDTGAKKRLLFVSVSSPVRAQQAPDAAEEEEEEEDGRDDGTAARGDWSGVEQPGNDGAQGIGLEDLEVVLDGVGRCDVVDVVLLLLSGEGGAMDEVGAFGVVRRVAEWFVGGRVSVLVASARGLERLVQVARALPHVAVVGKAGDEESVVRMHERARWRGPVVVGVHICTPMRLTLLTADHEEEEDEDTVDLQLDDRVPWRLIVRKRIEDMAPLLPLLDTQLDVAIEGVDAAKAIEMLSEANWLAEFVPYELPYGANYGCWRDVVLGQQQQQQQQGQVAPSALAAAKGPFVVLHSANGTLHAQRVLNERDVTSCDTVSLFWNPQLSSSSKGVSLANAVAQLNDLPVFGADARAISALQAEQFRSDHIQAPLPTVPAPKLTVRRPSVPATTTTSEYDRTWLLSTSLEPSSAVSPKWQGRLRRHQHWREKNLPISKLPRREHGLVFSASNDDDDGSVPLVDPVDEYGSYLGDTQWALSVKKAHTQADKTRKQNKMKLMEALKRKIKKANSTLTEDSPAFRVLYDKCKSSLNLEEQEQLLHAAELTKVVEDHFWAVDMFAKR